MRLNLRLSLRVRLRQVAYTKPFKSANQRAAVQTLVSHCSCFSALSHITRVPILPVSPLRCVYEARHGGRAKISENLKFSENFQ